MRTVVVILVLWIVGLGVWTISIVERATAQTQTHWKYELCYTNKCVQVLLERLPAERAAEAKITTWGQAGATYIWYRE